MSKRKPNTVARGIVQATTDAPVARMPDEAWLLQQSALVASMRDDVRELRVIVEGMIRQHKAAQQSRKRLVRLVRAYQEAAK